VSPVIIFFSPLLANTQSYSANIWID